MHTDIQAHPNGLLREPLKSIFEKGRWVEQEALLAVPGKTIGLCNLSHTVRSTILLTPRYQDPHRRA